MSARTNCFTIAGVKEEVAASDRESLVPQVAPTWVDGAVLCALIVVAVALRLPAMGESLWVDELHTAWTIAGGLRELPQRSAIGNHSPVYFLLPWLSVQVLGLHEFAVRLPSLLAGTALVPAIYCVARRWSGSRTAAVVAATLAVIDPDFILFASEARPYACVQLAAVLQVGLFWGRVNSGQWQWRVGWIASSALLFYLHYTAILLLVAQLVFLLVVRLFSRWRPAISLKSLVVDLLGIGVLMLPANWKQFVHPPYDLEQWQLFPLVPYLLLPTLFFYGYLLLQRLTGTPRPLAGRLSKLAPLTLSVCWLFVPLAIAYLTTRTGVAALWMHHSTAEGRTQEGCQRAVE